MSTGPAQLESGPVVLVDKVNHYYGEDESRNQVLFDNCLEIGARQLVIMTGPSGSGKTSLISLIGGLGRCKMERFRSLIAS
jgi:putative ABC transport system ATP-binding protein